jgi:hypothetical protein
MSDTRQRLPDIPASTTKPGEVLLQLAEPLLPSVVVAEEILTPDETFDKAVAEIKEYVKAHGWDAAAMFFGTSVYMGVYYTEAYFEVFGPVGRYIVHNLTMGVAANFSVLPFVRKGRLHEGKTPEEAKRDTISYFVLCAFPDSLYQPVEDFFIAVSKSGSLINFEFIQDATAEFSPVEIAASFAMFGVGFGLLYLVLKKMLIKHDEEAEVAVNAFDDQWQNFYKKCREMLQTPTWESVKSALQYFIFYLSDYFFDLSMDGASKTLLNLFGCCMSMAGYSFIFDNLPELFGYLEIRRARTLALAHRQPETLDSDYVDVTVIPDSEIDGFAVLGDILDRIVEPRSCVTNVVIAASDNARSVNTASTTSISSRRSSSIVSLSDSPLESIDSDVENSQPEKLDSIVKAEITQDDDIEIIEANEIDAAGLQKPLPSDPNNIPPYSAKLLQVFRSIANTTAQTLSSIKVKPSAVRVLDESDSRISGVVLRP